MYRSISVGFITVCDTGNEAVEVDFMDDTEISLSDIIESENCDELFVNDSVAKECVLLKRIAQKDKIKACLTIKQFFEILCKDMVFCLKIDKTKVKTTEVVQKITIFARL